MPGQPPRAPTIWPGLIILLASLGSPPAGAASLELEFAKGVVAFSRGDLVVAETHFEKVLEQEPMHTQAVYYLGQASLGLGKAKSAAELFRRVLKLDPSNQAVLLDLAQAQVKSQDFPGAEATLTRAVVALKVRASAHYYLGFCRYRQGRFREALGPLKKAQELDQGFAAPAGYYLGLAHLKVGQRKAAIQQFQRAARRSGAGEVAGFARESLNLLAGALDPADTRNWVVYLSSGAGFDSNVTLNPTDASGASSGTTFVSMGGTYSPLKTGSDELRLAGSLYRSFHMADEAQGFDLTDASVTLAWRHLFQSRHRLELGYTYNLDMLDGGNAARSMLGIDDFSVYMQAHQGRAVLAFFEGPRARTSVGYRFRALGFIDGLSERDSYGHELSVVQDLILADGRLHVALTAGALYEDGREKAWNLWGPFASLDARVKVREALSVWVQAAFHHEDHFDSVGAWDPGRQRVDNQWLLALGFTVNIMDELSLGVSYRYLKNKSLPGLSYQRHLVSSALMYRF